MHLIVRSKSNRAEIRISLIFAIFVSARLKAGFTQSVVVYKLIRVDARGRHSVTPMHMVAIGAHAFCQVFTMSVLATSYCGAMLLSLRPLLYDLHLAYKNYFSLCILSVWIGELIIMRSIFHMRILNVPSVVFLIDLTHLSIKLIHCFFLNYTLIIVYWLGHVLISLQSRHVTIKRLLCIFIAIIL